MSSLLTRLLPVASLLLVPLASVPRAAAARHPRLVASDTGAGAAPVATASPAERAPGAGAAATTAGDLANAAAATTPPASDGQTAAAGSPAPAPPAAALGAYATQLQRALAKTRLTGVPLGRRPGLTPPAVAAVELRIGADGALRGIDFGPGTLPRGSRELAPDLVLATEPLPPPDAALLDPARELSCLARLAFAQERRRIRAEAVVTCLGADGGIGAPAGPTGPLAGAPDAAAALVAGWAAAAAGDVAAASEQYARAVSLAPEWDLAARAHGLALVARKRVAAAIPFLRVYVASRLGAPDAAALGREIERFEREQAARAAELTRVRPRLGKEELVLGLRKGYPLLEPCLARARAEGLLAVGTDTVYLSFRIAKDGTVGSSQLDGPTKLLMTDAAECIERKVLAWRFPPYSEGSEVTARRLPIKVRGAEAPVAAAVASAGTPAAPAAAPEVAEEATFTTCERPAEDITAYVTARSGRIAACLAAEHRRNPNGWPDTLPISFVVDSEGPVRNVTLEHRFFRNGPVAACVAQALAGALEPSPGADCPAELPVDLRRFATLR